MGWGNYVQNYYFLGIMFDSVLDLIQLLSLICNKDLKVTVSLRKCHCFHHIINSFKYHCTVSPVEGGH